MGLREWTKNKLTLQYQKIRVFMDRYVVDVKQDGKSVPDLVESIMKRSGLVKE